MSRISGQGFAQSYVELHKVKSVQFGLLNPTEVQRLSVVNITNERIYDDRGMPNFQAVNDPRMGTMDKELKCFTCKGTQADCPGHFGHIELAKPVFHAGLIEFIRKTLRCVCFNCSKILLDEAKFEEIKRVKNYQLRFHRVLKYCDAIKVCSMEKGGCGYRQPKFTKTGLRIQIHLLDDNQNTGGDSLKVFHPDECLKVLENISNEHCEIIGFRPEISRPENMIIKNLAVAPPPVRPSVAMSNTMRSEDDLTYAYQKIIQTNNQLQTQISRGANLTVINELRQNLQYYVATLMDNEIQGQPTQKHKSGKPLKAIRARLRGKEGRLRGNLMGKRVDFSSRSVITPDPILQLDQLGVPLQIALNLTIPETVTAENIDRMRQLVDNGPNKWPGAKYIIRHDDRQIDLSQLRNRSDANLQYGYKVERHLFDGDYVIFNRQPSLHKMSLMGHRVKVLPFSTFRLNLSVTSPYNADFDGDEMNMHVPQSYETTAEIKEIMAVPNQIVSPQSNRPVMGIVQDSLLGVMLFTLKDTFIEKELVMNLLMWANYTDERLPSPTVLKPKPLWTGKQLLSLIIPDVNLAIQRDKNRSWDSNVDSNVLIQKGELICGNITGGTVGKSSGGLIHVIWKEKGPYACRDFLSNTQLLINNWLHQNGFTVGVQDIIAKKETIQDIRSTMEKFKKKVKKVMQSAQLGQLKTQPGKSMMESFEASINKTLNSARDVSGNMALADLQSWNRLKAMVYAGSKGSNLNISQIMACVGQQNVEGKRIPFGFHKRSLPHFAKDDYGPESKGFVESCYLTGLTPQEFYFHAMGGREGLIDTAVKTAETGYIQRRLIKALEDVMVKYDGTVRTSKEQIIQFIYGEDGMAGEHIEDLKINLMDMDNKQIQDKFEFLPKDLSHNQVEQYLRKSMDEQIAKNIIQDPQINFRLQKEFDQILIDRNDLRQKILKGQESSQHLPVNVPRIMWNAKEQFKIKPNTKTNLHPSYVLDKLENLMADLAPIPGVFVKRDELILEANSDSTWLFKIYLRSMLNTKTVIQSERYSKESFDWILGEIKSRFDQALVHPGEMVGSIGAQSIGEPATQMTLNTFHFAGVSAKNVTLGVPRLKEIINVAKNIKTPSMKIFLNDDIKTDEARVTQYGGQIEHTTLNHVVKNSAIYYDPDPTRTIVQDDQDLIELYNVVPDIDSENVQLNSWVLRFELDSDKMQFKDMNMEFIERKLKDNFQDNISIMRSDENAEKLVLRIRFIDLKDEDDDSVSMYLKDLQDKLFHDLALKGLYEISKVTFSKYNEIVYDPLTGKESVTKENYMIETDGVALQKVLGYENFNSSRTVSNDIIEILTVLGIEASRMSLINELRFVLSSYGIYVNYRHLSTLCDVMTQRGILTAITRHGINRVDSGPLRKCSFEETVEILLEASVFAETDPLRGITENIIMGQLAPYGTGCFDLVIDPIALQENAQTKPDEEENEGGNTEYMQEQEYNMNKNAMDLNFIAGTPMMGNTPAYGYGGASEYSTMGTPKYDAAFSPGPNQYGSPGYLQSPNPYLSPSYGMQTPNAGQSPLQYQANQSPIYQVPSYMPGQQSPGPQANQSPIYSPTTHIRMSSSYGNTISPAYQQSSQGSVNQIYGQSIGSHSPGYSPTQNQFGSYSPTGQNYSSSPKYSPTTPNYANHFSPQYSPTSNVHGSSSGPSPRYQVSSVSPRYSIDSSHQSATQSPAAGSQYGQASSMYIPQSPAYNPASVSSPAYGTNGNRGVPAYQGGSPIEDDSDQNDNNVKKEQ